MKKSKVLAVILCAVLLVTAAVVGTLAYLTDRETVTNTFTVGNVDLVLDEAKVTPDGVPVPGADRVKENDYHLIPGCTYTKDPTLTVMKNSEESYVRMVVTINCYDALTDIFGDGFLPEDFVSGWDETTWISTKQIDVDTATDTATYEFRYKTTVQPSSDTHLELEPLFTSLTLPGEVTGEQLKTLADLKIVVEGHAIQSIGFENAAEAWTAFDAQVNK